MNELRETKNNLQLAQEELEMLRMTRLGIKEAVEEAQAGLKEKVEDLQQQIEEKEFKPAKEKGKGDEIYKEYRELYDENLKREREQVILKWRM